MLVVPSRGAASGGDAVANGSIDGVLIELPGRQPVGGEPSERRVSGSHLVLMDRQGRTVAETVTDAKGAFHFALKPGDYVLADERNRTRVMVEPGKRVNLRLTWTNR
jgi:hypothetical protein